MEKGFFLNHHQGIIFVGFKVTKYGLFKTHKIV
jgi:hypothetical protein